MYVIYVQIAVAALASVPFMSGAAHEKWFQVITRFLISAAPIPGSVYQCRLLCQSLFHAAGTTFDWEGKRWLLIDVASPGFKIGSTKIIDAPPTSDLLFVQRPRQKEVIVDRAAGQCLGFR